MTAILLTTTVLLWGISQVFLKKATEQLSAATMALLSSIVSMVVWLPYVWYSGVAFTNTPLLLLIATIHAVGVVLYYEALAGGAVSIVGTVMAAYPVVTVSLAALFLQESPSPLQWAAIILVILGIIGLSLAPKGLKQGSRLSTALICALIGVVGWGVAEYLTKVAIYYGDQPAALLLVIGLVQLPACAAYAVGRRRSLGTRPVTSLFYGSIGVVVMSLGSIAYYLVFQQELVSIISPVAASYPAVTIVLARFFLAERLGLRQSFSLGLIVLGSVALAT